MVQANAAAQRLCERLARHTVCGGMQHSPLQAVPYVTTTPGVSLRQVRSRLLRPLA